MFQPAKTTQQKYIKLVLRWDLYEDSGQMTYQEREHASKITKNHPDFLERAMNKGKDCTTCVK